MLTADEADGTSALPERAMGACSPPTRRTGRPRPRGLGDMHADAGVS